MEVLYRKVFLKDLKKLKNQPVYDNVFKFAFKILPDAKALKGKRLSNPPFPISRAVVTFLP